MFSEILYHRSSRAIGRGRSGQRSAVVAEIPRLGAPQLPSRSPPISLAASTEMRQVPPLRAAIRSDAILTPAAEMRFGDPESP